jgi:hypothetical protein
VARLAPGIAFCTNSSVLVECSILELCKSIYNKWDCDIPSLHTPPQPTWVHVILLYNVNIFQIHFKSIKLRTTSVLCLPDVQPCHHNPSLPFWRKCISLHHRDGYHHSLFSKSECTSRLVFLFSKVKLLTFWRFLLHKLTVVHLANKLPAFYRIWLWVTRATNSPKKKPWTTTADYIAKLCLQSNNHFVPFTFPC